MIVRLKNIIWQNKLQELSKHLPHTTDIELSDDDVEFYYTMFPEYEEFLKYIPKIIDTDEYDTIFECDCSLGDDEGDLENLH